MSEILHTNAYLKAAKEAMDDFFSYLDTILPDTPEAMEELSFIDRSEDWLKLKYDLDEDFIEAMNAASVSYDKDAAPF